MQILDFTKDFVPAAVQLVRENYEEVRAQMPMLLPEPEFPMEEIEFFAGNGLGATAVEDGRLLGFLGAYPPFSPMYTTKDGVGAWSPLHAHATVKENREKIWQRLYQVAGEKWANAGCDYHSITLYASDTEAEHALFLYGFGMRCMDALRRTEPMPVVLPEGFMISELPHSERRRALPLKRALAEHMEQSPCFMRSSSEQVAQYLAEWLEKDTRVFAVMQHEAPVSFIDIAAEGGENFVSDNPRVRNIRGAYSMPQVRGTGVSRALLGYINNRLAAEGIEYFGVDFESINPTAYGFWSKDFTVYTHSVVRRIDGVQ